MQSWGLALALVDYMRGPGRYEGLDILEPQIAFARDTMTRAYAGFRFTAADVHNGHYNPGGRVGPEHYRFPYDDADFDVIFAASLYTHLLPDATLNYFRESRRVLRPGGACLFSFLLLDHYRRRGPCVASYHFDHPLAAAHGVAVQEPADPDAAIAYELALLGEFATEAGLRIRDVYPGHWADLPEGGLNEQDLLVLEHC